MLNFLVPKEIRPIVDTLRVLAEIIPPIRALIEGYRDGDALKRKRAFYQLEAEAERRGVRHVRGG